MIVVTVDYNNNQVIFENDELPNFKFQFDITQPHIMQAMMYEFINMLNHDDNNFQLVTINEDTRSIVEEW